MNIDIFKGFFKGKRVLVTGHTGFKGSWLCIWLHELGAEIVGIGLAPFSERDNFVLSGIGSKIKADIRADIRDGEKMKQIFAEYQLRLSSILQLNLSFVSLMRYLWIPMK